MANATHAVDDLFSPNSKYKVDFQSVVEERRDSREKNKQDIAVDEDDEKKKSKSKESEVRFGSKKRKQLEEGIEEDDSDTDESKSTTDDGSSEEEDNALEQGMKMTSVRYVDESEAPWLTCLGHNHSQLST